jgi:GYF domain 2
MSHNLPAGREDADVPQLRTDGEAAPQWYCRVFETEFGPLAFATLCEMIKSGQLGRDDQVRASGNGLWQSAGHVTALESCFAGTTASDPPAVHHGESSGLTQNVHARDLPQGRESRASICGSGSGHISVSAEDQWFYRLDAREHGPIKLIELQELIGSSGSVAEQVFVRQVDRTEWISFFDLKANAELAQAHRGRVGRTLGASPRPASIPLDVSSSGKALVRTAPRTLREFLTDNRPILAGVVIWGLINVGVLVAWSDPYSTERKYFMTLRQFEGDVHSLQSRNATTHEWTAFRAEAKQTLDPIVADLKRSASASRPVRQHLLSAARDLLPKLIRPDSPGKEVERLYQNHMEIVERKLDAR